MATKFVEVYDTRTKEKLEHLVPEHFLTLFPYLSKTPKAKAVQVEPTTADKPAPTKKEA